MNEIKNSILQKLTVAINKKDLATANEISKTLKENDLEYYGDKSVYKIGLALMYYYSNRNSISDIVVDSFLHKDVTSGTHPEEYFPGIEWFDIYIGCLLKKADTLEKEGKIKEALRLLKENTFCSNRPTNLTLKKEFVPLYEKEILLMHRLNDPDAFYAVKSLQNSGCNLSEEITGTIINSDSYHQFLQDISSLKEHEIKKDSVVFPSDIRLNYHANFTWIARFFYPELKNIAKWIFKKDLYIKGDLIESRYGIEVKGNAHITGNITGHDKSLLFKGNLLVEGYINAGGVNQTGQIGKFNCNGEIKTTLFTTNSKVNINGTIHPDTLIMVYNQSDSIEDYPCRYRVDVQEDYWTEEAREDLREGTLSFIWLDYDKVLEGLRNGENIFKTH